MSIRCCVLFFFLFSILSCDKVDNPDGLFDCEELTGDENEDDFGNLSLTINDSFFIVPCIIFKRSWGSYDLFWSEYDETCYREVLSSIGNFTYNSGESLLEIDSVSYYCKPLATFTVQTPYFHYGLVDHDAPLGAYNPNMDKYDVEFEISEFNAKRNIMRGSFSATLYLDQSCLEPRLRSADSVLVIQRANFEAPVNFQ